MKIKPIKTETDYESALKRADAIFDAKPGTPEGDELEILGLLIENYENRQFPIPSPDPIEAIKIRMEENGFKQADLISAIGAKSRVSDILNRKRPLTLTMARQLSSLLHLPASLLISEYSIGTEVKTGRTALTPGKGEWGTPVLKEKEVKYRKKPAKK